MSKSYSAEKGKNNGKSDRSSPSPRPPINCPECRSQRIWKDGLRHLENGEVVQRYLCRLCGYRFSEPKVQADISREIPEVSNPGDDDVQRPILYSDPALEKVIDESSLFGSEDIGPHGSSSSGSITETLNILRSHSDERRACAEEDDAKNLVKVETRKEWAAGAAKSNLLEYAWHEKKPGLAESTITQRVYRLKRLVRCGANLYDPDSVSSTLAREDWTPADKKVFIVAYKSFVHFAGLSWQSPETTVPQKLPFIPREEEINELIAHAERRLPPFYKCSKKRGLEAGKQANSSG